MVTQYTTAQLCTCLQKTFLSNPRSQLHLSSFPRRGRTSSFSRFAYFLSLTIPTPLRQDLSGFRSISMCHRTVLIHRCGHSMNHIAYCPDSTINPRTNRRLMCSNRSMTRTDQNQGLCNRADCILSRKGGVWVCCTCGAGASGSDRNRYPVCLNRRCNHEVCRSCEKWKRQSSR